MNNHNKILKQGYRRSADKWSSLADSAKKNNLALKDVLVHATGEPVLAPHGYFYIKDRNVSLRPVKRLTGVVLVKPKAQSKVKAVLRHIAKATIVAILAAVLVLFVLGYIEHANYKPGAYLWPVPEKNLVTVSYASGIEKRDLPGLGNDIVHGAEGGKTFRGKASYYSMDGCLGCHPYKDVNGGVYYLTANGDRFDEDAMALAVPAEWIKEGIVELGAVVSVENLATGKRVLGAIVNDSGGFAKYDRIADLTKGLAEELELKTDQEVEIRVLPTLDRIK